MASHRCTDHVLYSPGGPGECRNEFPKEYCTHKYSNFSQTKNLVLFQWFVRVRVGGHRDNLVCPKTQRGRTFHKSLFVHFSQSLEQFGFEMSLSIALCYVPRFNRPIGYRGVRIFSCHPMQPLMLK